MPFTSNIFRNGAGGRHDRATKILRNLANTVVVLLSIGLIVWISIDTFNHVELMSDSRYMAFQFWTCIFFMLDFFIGLACTGENRWISIRNNIIFLLLSIPWLNGVLYFNIDVNAEVLYFLRFIPIARGALAMSIVFGYVSKNAITSMFVAYLSVTLLTMYFCSLIFYQREYGVNPDVKSYWDSLYWSAMNLTTVGCSIQPVTTPGKVIAVLLPVCGMVMFPMLTVYIANYVTGKLKPITNSSADGGDSKKGSGPASGGGSGN